MPLYAPPNSIPGNLTVGGNGSFNGGSILIGPSGSIDAHLGNVSAATFLSNQITDIAFDAASRITLSAVGTGLNGSAAVAKAGAIAAPNAAGAGYVQADAATWVTALTAIIAAIKNIGVTA